MRTACRGTTGDDAFQSNTIPPQPARVELEGAAAGGAATGAVAAPPARDTTSASGTTSDPEEEEQEGVTAPATATLPAGSCAAEVQLCLQCRVAPQPLLPVDDDDDDDDDDALSVSLP